MKKILFILLLTCGAAPAFAQFHLGISAGGNYSFWKWHIKNLDTDINFRPAAGWRLALLGEWQFSPKVALRVEGDMQVKSNKSVRLTFPDGSSGGRFYEHYQYLGGSLLLQVKPLNKIPQLFLLGGFSDEWLYKGWSGLKNGAVEGHNGFSSPITLSDGNHTRNNTMADVGLGYDIQLNSRSKLKVEGRYQYMINNFAANNNVDASAHSLFLSLAYLHKL